jgi:RNA polymerase sigma factor (sigma-70 family)
LRPILVEPPVDELRDALASLPMRQRAVLVLRFYEDMSEADIAATLGCRPGTVKSLSSRGLAALRQVIER